MKKRLIIVVAVAILIVAGLLMVSAGSIYKWKRLPSSLDQYYKNYNYTSIPPQYPQYLIEMYELAASFEGVIVNIQKGDFTNATESFKAFSQNYETSSRKVPEWRNFYEPKAVKKLGRALDEHDTQGVFEAIGEVGETCDKCHIENMPPVWNRYNWKDFETVNINTPEGQLPWSAAKRKYLLVGGLHGIVVNIKQGNQSGAQQSFGLFKSMFDNMTDACSSCHSSERRYYVSADIQAMINDIGTNINNGNLTKAYGIMQRVGIESCYACHVLHSPAQFAKVSQK